MRCTFWAAFAALALGCGSSETATEVRDSRVWQLERMEAVAPPSDAVVATVNGRSIFASCVRIQAEAHNLSREDALQECIDFELLAEAAHEAGTQADPDVQSAAKQELVRTFIEERYSVRGPEDIPADLVKKLWDQVNVPRYNHPELRAIAFCRIPLTAEQGPESQEYKVGLAFIESVYEKLRDTRNLEKDDLFEPCWKPHYEDAGVHALKLNTFKLHPKSGYMPVFRESVFGAQEAGVVLPPVYSQYGIDLMLITELIPEKTSTFEEVEPELRTALFEIPVYESSRDAVFDKWYTPFAKARAISTHPERIPAAAPVLADISVGDAPAMVPAPSRAPN